MKIRSGFVSNSSTSSFCIYGVALEANIFELVRDEYLEAFKKKAMEYDGVEDEEEFDLEDAFDASNYEAMEALCKITGTHNLEWHSPDGYDCLYIGRAWSNVEDDQTGAQFKQEVRDSIKKILKVEDSDFGTHEEAYAD